jgi:hypothetical protein
MDNQTTPTSMPPVPPVYTTPTPTPTGHGREARMILPALLLVLLIGGGYIWYKERSHTPTPAVSNGTQTTTTGTAAKDVTVVNALATSGGNSSASTTTSKLPPGFPAGIPVEQATLTESYKANYASNGVTQYSVAYTSAKTKDALWKIYTDYATSAGFTVSASANKAKGLFSATKANNQLSVVISTPTASGSFVQLTYIEKK